VIPANRNRPATTNSQRFRFNTALVALGYAGSRWLRRSGLPHRRNPRAIAD
jgi:hypothetical protein